MKKTQNVICTTSDSFCLIAAQIVLFNNLKQTDEWNWGLTDVLLQFYTDIFINKEWYAQVCQHLSKNHTLAHRGDGGGTQIWRCTGMCCSTVLFFHRKSLNMGPFFFLYKTDPFLYESTFLVFCFFHRKSQNMGPIFHKKTLSCMSQTFLVFTWQTPSPPPTHTQRKKSENFVYFKQNGYSFFFFFWKENP